MSDYIAPDEDAQQGSSTTRSAKDEAVGVADTAKTAAKDVVGTAKDEAGSVAGEAKDQARELYHRTRQELGDQAAKQQDRLAAGLGAVGEQFGSMASGGEDGLASHLAQQASDRLGAAASWLKDRDPAAVLDEVKAYARRRPVVFIAGAAIAGIVVGRLTRALASSAADASRSSGRTLGPTYGDGATSTSDVADDPPSGEASGVVTGGYGVDDGLPFAGGVIIVDDSGDTPLYETVTGPGDRVEDVDGRRDSV